MTENTGVRALLVPLAPLAVLIALFALGEAAARAAIQLRYGNPSQALQETLDYAPYLISLSAPIPTAPPKQRGVFRVLVLGSSTAGGIPAEIIAGAFEPVLGRRVEVLNYAQPGHCTQQELVMYALYGMQVQPDLVMTLDGINDVVALTKSGRPGIPYEDLLIEQAMNDPQGFFLARLFRSSQLVNSMRKLLERKREVAIQSDAEAAREMVRLYRTNIEKLASITTGVGARYIAVLQPYLHLRQNAPASERRLAANYEYRRTYMIQMMRRLGAALREARFPTSARFVDATSAFDASGDTCFLDEAHLTTQAQTVLLRLVSGCLQEQMAPVAVAR